MDRRIYSKQQGEAAREDAIDRVEVSAGEQWMEHAMAAIRTVARSSPTFTTDNIWPLVQDPPSDVRAMGAAMRRAVRLGLCRRTEQTIRSLRSKCHRRDVRVWRSMFFEPQGSAAS